MDPYILVDRAEAQGKLPKPILRKVRSRAKYVAGAIKRVERASGLAYPAYFVEPVLPLSASGAEFGQMGVLYARVIPTAAAGSLTILVQFTAALIAFGSKGTIEAVAAHEFTHYFDLVRRLSRMEVVSDERTTTLFEAAHADSEKTVPPKLVFNDRALIGLISRKFKVGLSDDKLNEAVRKNWIDKKLPVRVMSPEENNIRVDIASVLATRFDPRLLKAISSAQEKMVR